MKVSELEGALLDYWVARAEGFTNTFEAFKDSPTPYSSKWEYGGLIIERERIDINTTVDGWGAYCDINTRMPGSTALEAAMRAYVAWKFDDEVEGAPHEAG